MTIRDDAVIRKIGREGGSEGRTGGSARERGGGRERERERER